MPRPEAWWTRTMMRIKGSLCCFFWRHWENLVQMPGDLSSSWRLFGLGVPQSLIDQKALSLQITLLTSHLYCLKSDWLSWQNARWISLCHIADAWKRAGCFPWFIASLSIIQVLEAGLCWQFCFCRMMHGTERSPFGLWVADTGKTLCSRYNMSIWLRRHEEWS